MAIDFTLTDEQKDLQRTAREFAQEVLKPVVAAADAEPDTQKAFQMMQPAYQQAYKLGFAYGFIPKKYGGPGYTNVDFQIVAEEIGVVDPGFDCILLCNGLALMPLHLVRQRGAEAQVAFAGAQRSHRELHLRLERLREGRHGELRPSRSEGRSRRDRRPRG